MREKVEVFLREQKEKLCVIATSSENQPHCAVVLFCVLDDLQLLINTHTTTQKWKDLVTNDNVALTVGWSFQGQNMQARGKAELINRDNDEFEALEERYFAEHPKSLRFRGSSDTGFIRIRLSWVRLIDPTAKPSKIEEGDL